MKEDLRPYAKEELRPYAERLAKAMPERFKLLKSALRDVEKMPHGTHWTDFAVYECELRIDRADSARWWAFFGPLLDEFDVRPHGWDKAGRPGTLVFDGGLPWLEAVAEAVCQEAERRARGVA